MKISNFRMITKHIAMIRKEKPEQLELTVVFRSGLSITGKWTWIDSSPNEIIVMEQASAKTQHYVELEEIVAVSV